MGNRHLRILLRVTLAVSLIVNAVMLGLILRLDAIRDQLGFDRGFALELRQEFRAQASGDAALSSAVQDVGAARAAMMDMLEAQPFDRAATEAQMAELRAATTALQAEAQRLLLDIAEGRSQN